MAWKREEPLRPTSVPVNPAQAPSYSPVLSGGFDLTQGEQQPMHEELASIGKSIDIKRKEQSSSKQPSSVERTLGAFSKPEPKPSMPPATSVTNDLIRV